MINFKTIYSDKAFKIIITNHICLKATIQYEQYQHSTLLSLLSIYLYYSQISTHSIQSLWFNGLTSYTCVCEKQRQSQNQAIFFSKTYILTLPHPGASDAREVWGFGWLLYHHPNFTCRCDRILTDGQSNY